MLVWFRRLALAATIHLSIAKRVSELLAAYSTQHGLLEGKPQSTTKLGSCKMEKTRGGAMRAIPFLPILLTLGACVTVGLW